MKCGRGKREKPREKPTQTPLRPPRHPHGGTETRTRDPSGGRRASNRLRHEAAFSTYYNYVIINCNIFLLTYLISMLYCTFYEMWSERSTKSFRTLTLTCKQINHTPTPFTFVQQQWSC